MAIKAILFGAAFFILPFYIGMLYHRLVTKNVTEILSNWVSGCVICLGYYEILVLPCVLFQIPLSALSTFYLISILAVAMLSIWLHRKSQKAIAEAVLEKIKRTPLLMLLAIALIALQAYVYVAYVHTDADDAFYVAAATTAVETDSVFQYNPYTGELYKNYPMRYVLSPFPVFIATLSQISGIHTAIMSHTVLPVFLILLSYGVYALVGKELFGGDRKKNGMFLFFISILSIFLYTNEYTQNTFMLMRIWQGKAFLASMLLPFLFYMEYWLITEKWKETEWVLLLFTMLSCSLVSSMGIMLGAIMVGIMGILHAFFQKNVKYLIKPFLCCLPNLILAVIYLLA